MITVVITRILKPRRFPGARMLPETTLQTKVDHPEEASSLVPISVPPSRPGTALGCGTNSSDSFAEFLSLRHTGMAVGEVDEKTKAPEGGWILPTSLSGDPR